MINVADWMDSFIAIKEEKKTKPMELEVRYYMLVNELKTGQNMLLFSKIDIYQTKCSYF